MMYGVKGTGVQSLVESLIESLVKSLVKSLDTSVINEPMSH